MTRLLEDLNPEQFKAVKIDKGPILVLAGAGSGKTRIITYRIAYLVSERNINAHNILAVTFTNKAADEMKSRVCRLLNDMDPPIWIKTYHSTCSKILRDASLCGAETCARIGIPQNFTIYDEQDQLLLIKDCIKELDINSKSLTPNFVLSMINRAKEYLILPEAYNPNLGLPFDEYVKAAYKLYNKRLTENNALDFDDLISKTVELFQRDKEILAHYRNRFKYILVDEYQDTNRAQYVLTNLLAEGHRNLCVVGDDDQSIYSWRGAEIKNILEFEKDYPDAVIIKLEQNYRSTKTILKAASNVVRNNRYRKQKTLWSDNEIGERIEYFKANDDSGEAAYVTRKILEYNLKDRALGDIAIFYRLNYQSRIFEEYLVQHRIPYEVVGALKFYERAEIKNILGYLRVIGNPKDSVSLKRIINLPARNIGQETIEKITQFQLFKCISFYEALKGIDEIERIKQRTKQSIKEFVEMIEKYISLRSKLNLHELAVELAKESGYLESLEIKQTEEEISRRKNVEQLLISIRDYVKTNKDATLEDYLECVSLKSDIDYWQADKEKVSLMTLHNAKGLEFNVVFITGLEDGLIPHYKSREEGRVEEERRLLYVGITRAKKKLHLTSAAQRETYRGMSITTRNSPFLSEIPGEVFATTLVTDSEEVSS